VIRKYFVVLLLLSAFASKADRLPCFDVQRGFNTGNFYRNVAVYIDCRRSPVSEIVKMPDSLFSVMNKKHIGVPIEMQDCYYWARFRLCNSSSIDQSVLFTSGAAAAFVLYSVANDGMVKELSGIKNNHILLHINAGDTIRYFVRHAFPLAGTKQFFSPYLTDFYTIVENSEDYFTDRKSAFFYFQILFTGMTGMLGLYLLISFFIIYDRSYLYYSLNIFSVVALVAVRLIHSETSAAEAHGYYALLIPGLQVLSHLFYFLFAMHFLNLKELLPRLAVFVRYVILLLIIYIITDFLLFISGDTIVIRMQLFFWIRILLIVIALGSIIYATRKPTVLLRMFTVGTFLMVISATVSFVMSYRMVNQDYGFWSIPFFYFLLGYLIDNVFFTMCLGYKNRMEQQDKLALERELFMQRAREREKSLKLIMDTQEQERNRMAEDLHDDLGSGLSTIRFFIESMKIKGETVQPHELHFISVKTAEIIENMRQIIWAVNPEHDNLADLLFYMKRYCGEYLEANKIDWNFSIPEHVADRILPPGLRRNLFAILKEALHNAVKHSGAQQVAIIFKCNEIHSGMMSCNLYITDNGKGFDVDTVHAEGNGLKNMFRRMKEAGGLSHIRSDNTGTTIELSFNIP
jgi:signal transduction histidine kinase